MKTFYLIILAMLFLIPSASALVTYPESIDYPYGTVNHLTVSHATSATFDIRINTTDVDGNPIDVYRFQKYLKDTETNIALDPYLCFPFDWRNYTINVYYYNNGTLFDSVSFGIDNGTYSTGLRICFRACDPWYLDMHAAHVLNINKPGHMYVTTNDYDTRSMAFFVTDLNRRIQGFTTGLSVNYSVLNNCIVWRYFSYNPRFYHINTPYNVYAGFSSATMNVSTDDTCINMTAFSCPAIISINVSTISEDASQAIDYTGMMIYFETYPGTGESSTGWWTGQDNSIGDMINAYGDSMGMPYFGLVIAFIIIIICVMTPLGVSIRYNLSFPNFIYAIMSSIGIVISTFLELMAVWMCAVFFTAMIITIVTKYKDSLTDAYHLVTAQPERLAEDKPVAEKRGLFPTINTGFIPVRRGKMRDVGVTNTSYQYSYHPESRGETKEERLRRIITQIESKPKNGHIKITNPSVLAEAKKELKRLESKGSEEQKNSFGILASNGHKTKRRHKR